MLNEKRQKSPVKQHNENLALIFPNVRHLEYYTPRCHVILGRGVVEIKKFYFPKRILPYHTQLVTKISLARYRRIKVFCIWVNGPYYRVSHTFPPNSIIIFLKCPVQWTLPSKYEAPTEKWTPHPPPHHPLVKEKKFALAINTCFSLINKNWLASISHSISSHVEYLKF